MAQSNKVAKAQRVEARRKAARRRQLIRWGSTAGVALVAIVLIVALSGSGQDLSGVADPLAWDLPDLHGEGRVALIDFEGRPTVAAFFASWCPHCRRELPGFADLADEFSAEVNFVGINAMDRGGGGAFAEQVGIGGWPLATDIGSGDRRELISEFGAQGMPATVIYDAAGNVADVRLGVLGADELRGILEQLLGK